MQAEYSAEAHTEYAADKIEHRCLSGEAIPLRECIREQIQTSEDHRRAEQDLKAQQVMALFTRVMAYTAAVGLFLGSGSVLLIYLTLRATQEMVIDTRRIGEAQVRAYMEIEGAQLVFGKDFDHSVDLENGIQAEVTIRNCGQTPAKRVRFRRSERSIGSAKVDDFDDGLTIKQFEPEFTLGAGASFAYKIDNFVKEAVLSGLRERTIFSIFAGELVYSDVFGQTHRTVFNLRIENFGTEKARIFPYGNGRNYSD